LIVVSLSGDDAKQMPSIKMIWIKLDYFLKNGSRFI